LNGDFVDSRFSFLNGDFVDSCCSSWNGDFVDSRSSSDGDFSMTFLLNLCCCLSIDCLPLNDSDCQPNDRHFLSKQTFCNGLLKQTLPLEEFFESRHRLCRHHKKCEFEQLVLLQQPYQFCLQYSFPFQKPPHLYSYLVLLPLLISLLLLLLLLLLKAI
jgi:hypothetical protein